MSTLAGTSSAQESMAPAAPKSNDTRQIGSPDEDWPGERAASLLTKKLKELAGALESRSSDTKFAQLFSADGLATPMMPRESHQIELTAFRVRRHVSLDNTLQPIVRRLNKFAESIAADASRTRVAFKVIRIRQSEGDSWTADVRCETVIDSREGIRQQTALWEVEFVLGATSDDVFIKRIKLDAWDEVESAGPSFADSTSAWLGSDATTKSQLARGSEFWYGRLDALGESQFMGHNGVAIGDVNGDNRDDVYAAQGTGLPNKLLVQQPDGTVEDRAVAAHVAWLDDTKGVAFADMDNDGDQDLVLAMGPSLVVAVNNGEGVFERFVNIRASTPAAFYSIALADYDLDGDLDIYGCRYVKVRYGTSVPLPFYDANNGPRNLLIRNNGDHKYSDATAESGLDVNNTRFSVAAGWADYDNDGDPDLYVSNDFGRNNLYRNDGGRFVDVAAQAHAEDQSAGMGVSWSDFDLDGDLDLHVSNMFSSAGRRVSEQRGFGMGIEGFAGSAVRSLSLGNSLLVNNGDGTFSDRSDEAGIRMGRWAWGARFVDLNNDGYDDVVVPNGFLTNRKEHDL